MWGTKTLARARRRLGLRAGEARGAPASDPTAVADVPADGELTVVLTRAEIDALAAALESRLGGTMPRLDSPARMEAALAELIDRRGGRGQPLVVRSPATLSTPEYWHIRISDADHATMAELEGLVGGRRID